jgi:cytochrome b subunit of formate dehydrogenase
MIKRAIFILIAIFMTFFWSYGILRAATPASEKDASKPTGVTKPPENAKKGEKFIFKGREYCYECIDNSECLGCHTKINERKFAQSVHGANSCNGCHWDITDVKAHVKARGGRIHTEPVTCHRCHKKEGAEHYASTHFINDIQCKDCHKNIHELTPWKGDKIRVVETCTTCHSDDGFAESVHGQSVTAGNPDSATCSDCHGLHKVPILKGDEPKVVEFRKEFHTEVCQKCHADEEMMKRNNVLPIATQTYYESYHGKVEHLGYPKLVAGCADCHGYHSILPMDNPKSLISDARLVETCGKCHPRANTNFVMWLPHATHNDPEREPVLYGVFMVMTTLLVSVFGVFWLHSILWWRKDYWEKRELRAKGIFFPPHLKPEEAGQMFRRFSAFDIILHFTMMVTFIGLVLTGIPLKFSHAPWASGLMRFMGGASLAGLIHRICAAITFAYFGVTLGYIVYFLFYKKIPGNPNFLYRLFGPDSLCPRWKDIEDIIGTIRWFFNKGPRPSYDRWTYWEKFDFLAVFWGMFAIGLSGLMLWLPEYFAIFLPGWIFNIATIVHSDEALLASGFIFTVHLFNTHLRPSKFPIDTVIFTGKLPKYEMIEERQVQYERMVAQGRLETYREKYPNVWVDLFSTIFGFAMLAIGLLCIFLIGWQFLG